MNEERGLRARFVNFVNGGTEVRNIFMEIYKKWVSEKGGYLLVDFYSD